MLIPTCMGAPPCMAYSICPCARHTPARSVPGVPDLPEHLRLLERASGRFAEGIRVAVMAPGNGHLVPQHLPFMRAPACHACKKGWKYCRMQYFQAAGTEFQPPRTDQMVCQDIVRPARVKAIQHVKALRDKMRRSHGLREDHCRFYYQQIILALDYCHKMSISNRDIKLENTLLDSTRADRNPLVKLCDFGYSINESHSLPKTAVGTPGYTGARACRSPPPGCTAAFGPPAAVPLHAQGLLEHQKGPVNSGVRFMLLMRCRSSGTTGQFSATGNWRPTSLKHPASSS